MIINSRQEPISVSNADHNKIMSLWERTAERVGPSRRRIAICRAIRRGLFTVRIPQTWLKGLEGQWLESAVPERWQLDLNLSNVLGEDVPEFNRTPLGTTDTAVEDADELEAWVNAVERDKYGGTDYDAMTGLAVQDGEWASLVLPRTAGMRRPPAYMEHHQQDKDGNVTILKPKSTYDRDERGRPADRPGYAGRSERQSRKAYDQSYERWLAMNPCWETRLISATDCAPIMTRGYGLHRWECTGLVIRTRYEPEDLIERGWEWANMGRAEMIPREFGTDSKYGDGGMVYLYEAYLLDKDRKPFCVYSVGGDETWQSTEQGEREAVIDLYKTHGLEHKTWDYHYGLHFEDDPAFRGVPFIWPLVPTLLNLEGLRTAIGAAAWRNSFTGKVIRPDPNVPPGAYLDGHGQFKPWEDPAPGQTKPIYGEVTPVEQARVGDDAFKMLAENRQQLMMASPDESQYGGGAPGESGHSKVVGHDLLMSGKRQLRDGILGCAESIATAKLRIADLQHTPMKGERKIDWPVFKAEEEVLDTGEDRTRMTTLALKERWIDGQYDITAKFPEKGNLAEVALEKDLMLAGASHIENVLKKKGVRNVTLEIAKIENYKWLTQTPEGQAESQMRAAKYRGDVERQKLIAAVMAQKATADGAPMAALGEGGGQQALPPPSAPSSATEIGSPVDASLNGAISGAMGTASRQADAQAQMQVQGGMG